MGVELPRALKSDIYHGRNLSLEYYNMNILTPFFLSREMNESNFRRAKLRIYIYFNYFSKGKKKKILKILEVWQCNSIFLFFSYQSTILTRMGKFTIKKKFTYNFNDENEWSIFTQKNKKIK